MSLSVDRNIQQRFRKPAQRKCEQIANEVVEHIRTSPDTPTNTGELRNSFFVVPTATGAKIDSTADYWRYVEFGTQEHGDAQHPVRSAMEAVLMRHGGLTPRKTRFRGR